MRRVYLPVVDRRFVMRSMAAALVASMIGCGTDQRDVEESSAPDGGIGPTADAPGPGFARCGDKMCFDLAAPANTMLRAVGGARLVNIDGRRLIIVRTAEDQFNVLSSICTHAGCGVVYSKARNDIECPCHGSRFALSGAVTKGPAATPLAAFTSSYDAASETLTVSA